MVNTIHIQNIASDAASILQQRLSDRRRSKPFEVLAERSDANLERDVLAALNREYESLSVSHPDVAEEVEELRKRLGRLLR